MQQINKIAILILIIYILQMLEGSVPNVTFEALKHGGFRAMIPDTGNITTFRFTANINEKLVKRRPGKLQKETDEVTENYLVLEFSNQLKVGDVVNYKVFIYENRLGYQRDGLSWEVSELLDSYSVLTTVCVPGSTIINGKPICIGHTILEDYFDKSSIDISTWIFEHKIPTYSEPNFEFNSYENSDQTRYLKNNILYLQPIVLKEENDVRGTLNLTEGCTSTKESECFYEQQSAFLLPPVKSAKMSSLINFKYGKIEIRAKLPSGDWIIPIIELEVTNNINSETKIWIAYSRGNNHLKGNSNDDIGSRMLFAGPLFHSTEPARSKNLVSRISTRPFYNDFNIYTVEWLPGSIKFYFNSELYGDVPISILESEFCLSLGVSVGGINDFPDEYTSDSGQKPWSNIERNYIKKFFDSRNAWLETWDEDASALKIDYVKIVAV